MTVVVSSFVLAVSELFAVLIFLCRNHREKIEIDYI